MSSYAGRDQKCDGCPRVDTCAEHRGQWFCYDCWHAAREKETPYHVVLYSTHGVLRAGEHKRASCTLPPYVYLLEEAEAHAASLNDRDAACGLPGRWKVEVAESWEGERMAHPAYMARRRAGVIAMHPQYAKKENT